MAKTIPSADGGKHFVGRVVLERPRIHSRGREACTSVYLDGKDILHLYQSNPRCQQEQQCDSLGSLSSNAKGHGYIPLYHLKHD